jgi:hypothetical protein
MGTRSGVGGSSCIVERANRRASPSILPKRGREDHDPNVP